MLKLEVAPGEYRWLGEALEEKICRMEEDNHKYSDEAFKHKLSGIKSMLERLDEVTINSHTSSSFAELLDEE